MKNTNQNKNESGFSLIELLIVSVILVFIIGIIVGIITGVQRNYTQQRAQTEAINDATAALDLMTRLIRTAGNNPNNISGFQALNPGTDISGIYRAIQIRSDWRGVTMDSFPDGDTNDPFENIYFFVQNGKLMKQEATDMIAVEFLDNVDSIQFVYYDTNNNLITNPSASPTSISRIDIRLVMKSYDASSSLMTFRSSAFMRQR
jgi:type II secretory pathway pseudopilin PulG